LIVMLTRPTWIVVFLLAGLLLAGCRAESAPGQEANLSVADTTQARFERVMDYAKEANLHERPIGEIMQVLGQQFMERPYLTGTLDEPATEQLVIRFDGFDCVTFVETVLAMARGVAVQDYRFGTFARHLEDQRYRDGALDGYCSRLHYFTEWIDDNAARGTIRSLTADLGGVVLRDSVDFMSTHRSAYPRFATNDSLWACVRGMEARLQSRTIRYVPQDRIRAVYDRLEAGDIIGIATSIDGLDISHTGLVYEAQDGRIGLLHASTSGGVKVSPDLQRYVQNIEHQIGILVARPLTPHSTSQ
jgi:hypothetical protein